MNWLKLILILGIAAPLPASAQAASGVDLNALAKRVSPGEGQEALQPLAGMWRVTKQIFVAMGTPDRPAQSENMTTERRWIGDGRFLLDTTTGSVEGRPYFRTGILGYNNMEKRYEWTTADNQTPIMMTYTAAEGSATAKPIDMTGQFADPGVTGERNVNKIVAMRTRIEIVDANKHIFEIYFTLPGGAEMLADRMVFARIK